MEISEKSNFKTKILAALLVFAIMFAQFGFIGAVRAAEETTMADVKLNRIVQFTGETYWLPNFKNKWKNYADGSRGMGIVGHRLRSKDAVYILGEGYIRPRQIIKDSIQKFIDIDFKLDKDNNALKLNATINGEYVHLVSENTGIIKQEGNSLLIGANGSTKVTFVKRDETGKVIQEIPAVATSYDGGVKFTLNEGEKSLRAAITDHTGDEAKGANAEVVFGDEKVILDLDAHGNVIAKIDDGAITITGKGDAELSVNGQEVARVDVEGKVKGSLNKNKDGVILEITDAKQSLTLFKRVRATLTENAKLEINTKSIEATGDVAIGGAYDEKDVTDKKDEELAKVSAGARWEYGDNDPQAYAQLDIKEKTVAGSKEFKPIPVKEAIKGLKGLVGGATGTASATDVAGAVTSTADILETVAGALMK